MTRIADSCYLVMSEYGIQKMNKRPPALAAGEIAVKVTLTVPEACFARAAVEAQIQVPESAIIQPKVDVRVEDASADVTQG